MSEAAVAAVGPAPETAPTRPLRVVGFGTSNLLLRHGFRQTLENDPRIAFQNLALGASGTVQLGLRLNEASLGDTDVALLEFAVNEENFVNDGHSSLEAIVNAMRLAVDRACRAGATPMLVVLPNLPFLEKPNAAEAMRETFRRAGLPVFDVAKAVSDAAALGGVRPKALFRDPKHLKRSVARAFGVLMIEAMTDLPLDRRAPLRETGAPFRELSFIPATKLVGETSPKLFQRQTRLISATGALLEDGAPLTVPDLGGPASIVGVLANAARTRGLLAAEDGAEIAFSVPDAKWSDDPDSFILVARPVDPVRIPRGGKTFRVAASPAKEEAGRAQIELCGLFVRSDAAPSRMAIAPMPARFRDLNALIPEQSLRMIATLAHCED